MDINRRLKKTERISGQKDIDCLFSEGNAFLAFPLRVVYTTKSVENESDAGVSILASVTKKRFKHAVDRNRIKRLIRETYRLNKSEILAQAITQKCHLYIAFLYIHQQRADFEEVKKGMKKALEILKGKLS